MTGRKIRWHRYTDQRGGIISVRAVQTPSGKWREFWTTEQLMAANLSQDEGDTSPQPVLVYRSVSDSSGGFQPHNGSPKRGRATKNTNRKEPNRG